MSRKAAVYASVWCLIGGGAGWLLALLIYLFKRSDDPWQAWLHWGRGGFLTPFLIGCVGVGVALLFAVHKYSLTYGRPLAGAVVGLVAGFLAPPTTSISPSVREQLVLENPLYGFEVIGLAIACVAVGAAIGTFLAKPRANELPSANRSS